MTQPRRPERDEWGQQGYPPQPYGNRGYPRHQVHGRPPLRPLQMPARDDYARWKKRVAARLIDDVPWLIALVVLSAGYVMWFLRIIDLAQTESPNGGLFGFPGSSEAVYVLLVASSSFSGPWINVWLIGAVLQVPALGWTLYNRWIVAGRTGQSLGKRIMKTALISERTSRPIGATSAFARDLLQIIDWITCVGILWPLWDAKRQTFSDMLAGTVVVDRCMNQSTPPGL